MSNDRMSKEAPKFKHQAPEKLQTPRPRVNASLSDSMKVLRVFAMALVAGIFVIGCAGKQQVKAGNAPPAGATNAVSPEDAKAKAAGEALDALIKKAAAEPAWQVEGTGWKPLFDGRTLAGWAQTDFSGRGQVHCESGLMILDMGDSLTGVNSTNAAPKVNYEIALEAMKLQGSDFFCGLTFPVKDSFCSLILGGWGGTVVGLSSIEGQDASENETTQFENFETGKWYRVRLRVTDKKIEAWLDDKQIVNLITEGRTIALRFGEIESSKPLGIASYETAAALRGIKIRRLE
jgi:hypothetical protein